MIERIGLTRNLLYRMQRIVKTGGGPQPGIAASVGTSMVDEIDLMLRVKAGDWLSFATLMDRHRAGSRKFVLQQAPQPCPDGGVGPGGFPAGLLRAVASYQPPGKAAHGGPAAQVLRCG